MKKWWYHVNRIVESGLLMQGVSETVTNKAEE